MLTIYNGHVYVSISNMGIHYHIEMAIVMIWNMAALCEFNTDILLFDHSKKGQP